jgi:hypothetical protein
MKVDGDLSNFGMDEIILQLILQWKVFKKLL